MSTAKKRVLIVDDDQDQCETLAEIIGDWGYQTEMASDGLAAKKILITDHFDLVLTDMRMPNMSGMELIEYIAKSPQPPPVVVLSGFSDYSKEELKTHGVVAILAKPVDVSQLRLQIESALAQHK